MSKIVVARYIVKEAFIVPKGIDLEDKKTVKQFTVKYNKLYILLTNGEEIIVDAQGWSDDIDWKYPDEESIEDASNYGIDEEESK